MDEEIGQLSLDIIQEKDEIIILAPIAGTSLKDVTISVTDDVLTVKGARPSPYNVEERMYLTKECFWGDFTRSIVLPKDVNTKEIKATSLNNILEIHIPRTKEEKTKVVKINVD
jgi:HSP20 family protein